MTTTHSTALKQEDLFEGQDENSSQKVSPKVKNKLQAMLDSCADEQKAHRENVDPKKHRENVDPKKHRENVEPKKHRENVEPKTHRENVGK